LSEETQLVEAKKGGAPTKPPFSIDYCSNLLFGMMGADIKFNVITGEIDVMGNLALLGQDMNDVPHFKRLETLATLIHSEARNAFKQCDRSTIQSYLEALAYQRNYNPVYDHIAGVAFRWDKADRLPEVYRILGIDEQDTLSRILIKKWFHQGISLLLNNDKSPIAPDGILVLCGRQGAGKTSFFRKIAIKPEWFGEGLCISQYDKDTKRRVVTSWIAELGELETTMKGDIAALKAFITSPRDQYRLPYGRSDTVSARRTNLCATCNTTDFLVDQTGNRRFWVVPVGATDLDALRKLDAEQLWAQMLLQCENDRDGFRLTRDELAQLEERNGKHVASLPAEDEVRDILQEAEAFPERWQDTTVTNFVSCYKPLQKYSVKKVSQALDKLGIEPKRLRVSGEVQRLRRLPILSPYAAVNG
jgi:predicted P-loop ATPase